MKITKYGDRLLETIEATIREHYKDKSSSSSNDSSDSKRRRDASNNISVGNSIDDDFSHSTARSKKRLVDKKNKDSDAFGHVYPALEEFQDIDFDDNLFDVEVSGGRVLPSWSTNGSEVHG